MVIEAETVVDILEVTELVGVTDALGGNDVEVEEDGKKVLKNGLDDTKLVERGDSLDVTEGTEVVCGETGDDTEAVDDEEGCVVDRTGAHIQPGSARLAEKEHLRSSQPGTGAFLFRQSWNAGLFAL